MRPEREGGAGQEKPRVTEILVRIDCNGCVQKIKKALHSVNGIYELHIDFPQQKLRVIGWADPEKIIKAIRKTRKSATICSHFEIQEPPADPPGEPAPAPAPPDDQAPPPPPDGGNPTPPPPDGPGYQPPPEGNPPPQEPQQPQQPDQPSRDQPPMPPQDHYRDQPPPDYYREQPPPPSHRHMDQGPSSQHSEPPMDQPPPPPQGDGAPPQEPQPPPYHVNQPGHPRPPPGVEEVHVVHHHPPDYPYRQSYGPPPVPGPMDSPYMMSGGYNRLSWPQPGPRPVHGYNSFGEVNSDQGYARQSRPIPRSYSYREGYGETSQPGPRPIPRYSYGEGYGDPYARQSEPQPTPRPIPSYSCGQEYSGTYASHPPPQSSSSGPVHGYGNEQQQYDGNLGGGGGSQHHEPMMRQEPQPVYVTHSYNQHRPSSYVTQYEYVQSPQPPPPPTSNNNIPYNPRRVDNYSYTYDDPDYLHNSYSNGAGVYQSGQQYSNGNGNITSIFSEENPNSCTIC